MVVMVPIQYKIGDGLAHFEEQALVSTKSFIDKMHSYVGDLK